MYGKSVQEGRTLPPKFRLPWVVLFAGRRCHGFSSLEQEEGYLLSISLRFSFR